MSKLKQDRPLCVDLDGTLVKTDTLHEALVRLLKENPFSLLNIVIWMFRGKAYLKEKLANKIIINPTNLPYNTELIDWLKNQKKIGRKLILCTASDIRVANAISDYLNIFDDVIASNGANNLAGKNKANILIDRFGVEGFDYVGNSKVDIHVWKFACKAIIVNASKKIIKDVKSFMEIELIINNINNNKFSLWIKALRIHQWLKNLLLFVPVLAAHKFVTIVDFEALLVAFLSFSVCASSVYIANDIFDLESDRGHPRKSKRPFASGELEVWKGIIVSLILLIASFLLATKVNQTFTTCLIIYFTLTCLYSLKLKQFVLVDCLSLAILYTLRIISGSFVLDLPISFWILTFSVFLFLSLAFVKRYSELQLHLLHGKNTAIGRGYLTDDGPLIQILGVVSGLLSSLVLAFYLNSQKVVELYSTPEWIWGCIPVLIFWISWVWLQAQRGKMHDDPLVFAVKDKASIISGACFSIFIILGTFL